MHYYYQFPVLIFMYKIQYGRIEKKLTKISLFLRLKIYIFCYNYASTVNAFHNFTNVEQPTFITVLIMISVNLISQCPNFSHSALRICKFLIDQ